MGRNRGLVCGVGVNDAKEKVHGEFVMPSGEIVNGVNPFYSRWSSMLARCYSKSDNPMFKPYKDFSVCDEWLTFSGFRDWMEQQDWEGKDLDKDLLENPKKSVLPADLHVHR